MKTGGGVLVSCDNSIIKINIRCGNSNSLDWEQRKLGSLVIIKSGLSINNQKRNSIYKITRIETISNGYIDISKTGSTNEKPNDKYLMHSGDILFSNINSMKHIGKTALFNGSSVLYHGMNLLRLVANANINPRFLYYELTTINHRNWVEAHANPAVNQASINQHELSLEPMYVTNFNEQAKISDLILQIDKIINLQQRRLEQLRQLKKAMLQQVFAGQNKAQPITRFEGFNEDWHQRKLKSLAGKTFGGGTPSKSNKEFWNGDFPWIQSSDLSEEAINDVHPNHFITQNAISASATKKVPKNSIAIVSRVGVGKVALIPFDYTTSQDFLSLSKLKINTWFATYSIHRVMQKAASQIQGTSIKGITKKDVLDKQLCFPASVKEQVQLSNLLRRLDYLLSLQQLHLEQLSSCKKFLLQNLFI